MADTGFKTTGAVVSAGTWSNMTTTRINTADDSRATATGNVFKVATLNNYSFGIPSGATIDGIEVNTEFSTDSGVATATLQLSLSWNNGTNYTATKSDTVTGSTTDKNSTLGGAADTWGRSWTDTEFANGTLLVKVEGKSSSAVQACRLDFLQIKVYYTVSGGWSNIAKINNITSASVAKIQNIAVASIAKVNNIAV